MAEPTPAERRALFAQEFQGTTNLDQRRRFAQELSEAKTRSEERDQALFEQEQRKNPKLMQAVTGRARERRMTIEGMDRADLAERKFTWDQEKAVRAQGLQERSILLRERQEDRLLKQAEDDLDTAFRIEEDTDLFRQAEKGLRERGLMPGTQAYRDGLAQVVVDHPYVDPKYRDPILEGAGITDPNDLQRKMAALREKLPNARITIPEDGIPRIVDAPVSEKPESRMDVDAELAKAYAARNRAKKSEDEDYRIFTENRIRELEKLKAGGQQPQATPAQPKAITVDDARSILKEVGGDKEKARALARERGYQW